MLTHGFLIGAQSSRLASFTVPLFIQGLSMWSIYQHTKGMYYLHVGMALHSESLEPLEVYRTLYDNELGPLWVRPREMFHEEVLPGKKRFTRVGAIRVATHEDDAMILPFGHDAWGNGKSVAEFVAEYERDKNHIRGTRYLFEDATGEVLANLNTIRFARGLVGIASLSVHPAHRRKGYGALLVRGVMEVFRQEDAEVRFLLFSEVDPKMYEKLGFIKVPEEGQLHLPSVAMISGCGPITERELSFFREYF